MRTWRAIGRRRAPDPRLLGRTLHHHLLSGRLSRSETEGVNFRFASLPEMLEKYDPRKLTDGYNTVDGEEIFFVSNPALGLWAHRSRF